MILIAYGTRPEWLKVKPIIKSLRTNKISHRVLFTGQHKNISGNYYDIKLEMCAKIFSRLDQVFVSILNEIDKKDAFKNISAVLVQGDTASVFALSLAAFHRKIKLIHLEAGLRTYDKDNPYPEEMYRQMVSRIADYHLCPNENNKINLEKEKTSGEKFVIGNTALDNISNISTSYEDVVLITMHRRENLELISHWFDVFDILAEENSQVDFVLPVHPNPTIINHSKKLKNVRVIDAMKHDDLIDILRRAKVVITDSGGIQEESSFLRKKCIVCRKTTERVESIDQNSILCIFERCINDFKIKDSYSCPYGDGKASLNFVNLIKSGKIKIKSI